MILILCYILNNGYRGNYFNCIKVVVKSEYSAYDLCVVLLNYNDDLKEGVGLQSRIEKQKQTGSIGCILTGIL